MKSRMRIMLGASIAALAFVTAQAAVKPVDVDVKFPEVWEKAGPQARLMATRAAEVDANRLLLERILGVNVSGDTVVYDLVLEHDDLAAEIEGKIKGVATTEAPEYLDDGRVQVVRAVTYRTVVETISQYVRKKALLGVWFTTEQLTEMERKNVDTTIDVMGNSALPGSEGLKKIQAKRAAEIDAYRKLAERVLGMEISSQTHVKDFVLQSDIIRARVAQLIKSAKPIAIRYLPDDSCEVDMQMKTADIYEVVKKYGKGPNVAVETTSEIKENLFTETGAGAPRPEGFVAEVLSDSGESDDDTVLNAKEHKRFAHFTETEIILKRLVGTGTVLE